MRNLLFAFIGLLLISSCKKEGPKKVTSITISPSSPNVAAGLTQQLTTTITPADAEKKEVTWSSSDEKIATVDVAGIVTGRGKGTAVITATATDGSNTKGMATVTVTVKVTSITISPSSPNVAVGLPQQLTTTIAPADAEKKEVTWSSSDEKIATVDAAGIVTGRGKGTAVITATATDGSNTKGTVTVTVTVNTTSIIISPSSPKVAVGLPQQLTTTIAPADAEKKEVTWSSSDEKIATVDAAGIVTGRGKGTAVITATATDGSNTKGTVTITVTVNATSIAISPANPSVDVGKNLTFTVVVAPSDAAQTVTWASSDPSKATIDPATGVVNGVAAGTTTITATAADGSGVTQTATLTVNSTNASITAITLGEETLTVTVPAEVTAITIANAPRSIAVDLTRVKVNITATANAAIKMGNNPFISGTIVDFTNPITFTATAQDGTTVKNYTVAIPPYSAANPYGIYTVKHLVDVKDGVTASFLLKNNIDLPNASADGATATGINDYATAGWKPFPPFNGTFDGGNFSINNFYANRGAKRVGLFEILVRGGTIKNLGVNGTALGQAVIGGRNEDIQYTGVLVGYNEGSIDKCYATGIVSATTASSNFFIDAGGLVGHNAEGSISNSYAAVDVSVSSSLGSIAGGLVGRNNDGSINNSYATGIVTATITSEADDGGVAAGGLVGLCGSGTRSSANRDTPISNSYATGNASVTAPAAAPTALVGGLVAFNFTPPNGGHTITYTNCFRNSNAVLKKNDQGAAPNDVNTGITAKNLADMQKDEFKTSLNAGGSVWGREDSKNNKLPYIIGVGVGK